MSTNGRLYPVEEVARRASEIYARIKPKIDPGNDGKVLAIDIESGEYEVDDDQMRALDRLFDRLPSPQCFCYRIGYQAVHGFGGFPPRLAS